jgi:stage IV sporulation protein FB
MREHGNWSVGLGRWGGLHVRLHVFFLLFATVTLYLSWLDQRGEAAGGLAAVVAMGLGILLVSVLLHSLGHHYAATRLGGNVDQIVIWPLGELSPIRPPREPHAELVVHSAGPLVNLVMCLACAALLLTQTNGALIGLLHPLHPENLTEGSMWLVGLKLTFWINWLLLLVNLIPAFPFDGGRALRAVLAAQWSHAGRRHASVVVARLAQVAAVGLLIVAWLVRGEEPAGVTPAWFALVLLAICLFFSASYEQERYDDDPEDDELFGYDFSQGYTSLERTDDPPQSKPGPVSQWIEQRRQAKLRRQREIEEEEERRVDEILVRLHEHGLESLSRDDRELLERVSTRYRKREGHGA